ncbi:hypothetical protein IAQ61_007009, partial [Plenodomus lingam]
HERPISHKRPHSSAKVEVAENRDQISSMFTRREEMSKVVSPHCLHQYLWILDDQCIGRGGRNL